MNCPYCGFLCEEGIRFCPSCGSQIVSDTPEFAAPAAQPAAPAMPTAEALKRMQEEKSVKTFRTLIVLSLFLALALVAGAVYLMAFMPEEKPEKEPEKTPVEIIVPETVGSWANEDGFIILTASGKFAADNLSGKYTMDETVVVLDGGDTIIVAEYVIEEDTITLTTSYLGRESTYIYYKVSERTDLSRSQLKELWEELNVQAG